MKLAKIFTNNMMLQAEKSIRFFGEGKGKVESTIEKNVYKKSFDGEMWEMELPSHAYGGPFDIQVRLNGEETVLKNVLFGDVFLFAGQSNVQFLVKEEKGKYIENNPQLRFYVSDRIVAYEGLKSEDGWQLGEKESIAEWSALGYHVAEKYSAKKGVPVGVVGCYQGASVIRSWMPERELDESVFVELEKRHGDHLVEEWSVWNRDCQLYKFTFSPLIPFSFKGVIWYQGESDTTVEEGKVYTQLLAKLIKAWREDLQDKDLPFIVVEICDFDSRNDDGWRAIQKCQQEVSGIVKNVTTVTSKDVCAHNNIHPADKEQLAVKIVEVL